MFFGWKFLADLAFPESCLGCGKNLKNAAICPACRNALFSGLNGTLFCGRCRARLPEARKICHKDFPYVLGAAADYGSEAVKSAIRALKFGFSRSAAEPLAGMLAAYALRIPIDWSSFAVVPMPLSGKRLRRRGFNQAELIAKIFSDKLGLVCATDLLVRKKHAKPQSETKSAALRRLNVRGAFAVRNRAAVAGKNLILIDDVTTSGATFFEASLALREAGAKKIIALAAAKA